jgi:4-hydroxy-3-polyprenylbenzoate decarboxylase
VTCRKIVIGITGASGAPYATRCIQVLLESGAEVHLAVSTLGRRLLFEECAIHDIDAEGLGVSGFSDRLFVYNDRDLGARIASGTFLHDGMVVLPCSSNTLGAIASGITNSLIQRAAAVTLKERRRLVLAHRETPLSPIDLKNMCTVTNAGAIVAPLSPGFYMTPTSIPDLVDFMVGKLVDLVDLDHKMPVRWDPVVGR